MSDIAPINHTNASVLGGTTRAARPHSQAASPVRGSDRAEFSQAAQLLSKLAELPDVRQDLIDRVRAELADGNYDTPDKVEALLDSLIEDLA